MTELSESSASSMAAHKARAVWINRLLADEIE